MPKVLQTTTGHHFLKSLPQLVTLQPTPLITVSNVRFFVDGRKEEELEVLVTTTVTTRQTDVKPATDAAVT